MGRPSPAPRAQYPDMLGRANPRSTSRQRRVGLMMLRWRTFPLLAMLMAAPGGPALGQGQLAVAPAGVGNNQSFGPIPDLTGAWGHNFLLFEPPSAGAGPVVTKLRKRDGTGVFSAAGDDTNPILKPQAAEVVKRNAERELGGAPIPNPHNQCWPEPTPFNLNIQFGMRIIQRKDEVLLLYLSDHQVRRVRMNVPHAAHPTPTWQGESVGHYEGDTLVVDTTGQKVGPLSMIDRFGTPFSAGMRVIERYRLIDGALAQKLQLKHEHDYFLNGSPF